MGSEAMWAHSAPTSIPPGGVCKAHCHSSPVGQPSSLTKLAQSTGTIFVTCERNEQAALALFGPDKGG